MVTQSPPPHPSPHIMITQWTTELLALQFWAEWWAGELGLISTFQDVTKYTIGGIISDLHTPPAEREEAVIKILS